VQWIEALCRRRRGACDHWIICSIHEHQEMPSFDHDSCRLLDVIGRHRQIKRLDQYISRLCRITLIDPDERDEYFRKQADVLGPPYVLIKFRLEPKHDLKTGSICSKVFDVLGYLGHRRDECSEISLTMLLLGC
jgi:hypothetical protein